MYSFIGGTVKYTHRFRPLTVVPAPLENPTPFKSPDLLGTPTTTNIESYESNNTPPQAVRLGCKIRVFG